MRKIQNNFAKDKAVNESFVSALSAEQKEFFNSVGVNPMRVRAVVKVHDIPDDGSTLPETLETVQIDADKMPFYNLGEFGVVFNHPYFRDPKMFSEWNCGYIMGSILTMKDL